jgi:hypothetical protein
MPLLRHLTLHIGNEWSKRNATSRSSELSWFALSSHWTASGVVLPWKRVYVLVILLSDGKGGQIQRNPCILVHEIIIAYNTLARSSVVVEALCYKPEGRGFDFRWSHWFFTISLILPASLGSRVYSTSSWNEYQKLKKKMFWGGAERGQCVGRSALPPSMRHLSRQCKIPNIPTL